LTDETITVSKNVMTPFTYILNGSNYKNVINNADGTASLDSGNTGNTDVQAISAEIYKAFPSTAVTAWRVTLETNNTYTVTITDVDISELKAGTYVKVIRYNSGSNYHSYTSAYIPVKTYTDAQGNSYNALYIEKSMDKTNWKEIGYDGSTGTRLQTYEMKHNYSQAVDFYNSYPDTKQ
jgi:hypothetical protein